MLGLLFTVLDEASREGGRLQDYLVLVDEANGLDRTLDLMNEHEDMEVYDKVTFAKADKPIFWKPRSRICTCLVLYALILG